MINLCLNGKFSAESFKPFWVTYSEIWFGIHPLYQLQNIHRFWTILSKAVGEQYKKNEILLQIHVMIYSTRWIKKCEQYFLQWFNGHIKCFNKQRSQVIIHINLICVTTITVRETILYQHERFAMLSISISFFISSSKIYKFIRKIQECLLLKHCLLSNTTKLISFQCIQV